MMTRTLQSIIYMWKIIEGIVPNTSLTDVITSREHLRLGRLCHLPFVCRGPYQALRNTSFDVKAPLLFIPLRRKECDLKNTTKEVSKNELDFHLRNIWDKPLLPGYVTYRRADTNSILDAHLCTQRCSRSGFLCVGYLISNKFF